MPRVPPADVHRATPAADPTESAEAAKDRGNALFKSGDFKSAELAYTEAIALDPSSAAYHANRAAARLKLHDHANALADATAALALDGSHTKARHRRAMALAKLGRHDEAAAEYDFVERAYPGHAGVRAEAKAARDAAETARVQSKAAAATEREKAKAMAAAVAEEEGVSAPSSPARYFARLFAERFERVVAAVDGIHAGEVEAGGGGQGRGGRGDPPREAELEEAEDRDGARARVQVHAR